MHGKSLKVQTRHGQTQEMRAVAAQRTKARSKARPKRSQAWAQAQVKAWSKHGQSMVKARSKNGQSTAKEQPNPVKQTHRDLPTCCIGISDSGQVYQDGALLQQGPVVADAA